MRVSLSVQGLDAVTASMAGFSERRIRSTIATVLTRVAVAAKDAERREMIDSLDRPTPYTLNSVYARPATAERLESEVGIKNDASGGHPPTAWLRWQVHGGLRRWTGFERALIRGGAMPDHMRAVPGRFARLDGYGNLSRGQMAQIISQLRIETGRAGSTRTLPIVTAADSAKDRSRKLKAIRSQQRRAGGQFIALPVGRGKLRPGIYLVRDTAWGRTAPKPIVVFVSQAQYQPRFDFYFVARQAAGQLGAQLERAVAESIARRAGGRP